MSLHRRLLARVGAAVGPHVDGAFVRFAIAPSPSDRKRPAEESARILDSAASFYGSTDARARLWAPPAEADPAETVREQLPGGAVVDLAWPTPFEPVHDAYDAILAKTPQTKTARARWYRAQTPRTALVVLHGWGMGFPGFDARAFRARWLYDQGLDVALVQAPFHGERLPPGQRAPMFPTANPFRTVEAFAQAVAEIRALIATLRRRGAPKVGVTGMSLGGFTAALLATVEPEIDFLAPVLPFASYPALTWDHAEHLGRLDPAQREHVGRERYEAAFGAVEPLRREPLVDPAQTLVVAAVGDGVTPPHHAEQLHAHFAGSRYMTIPGSHLVQVGRGRAFRALVELARRAPDRPR